MTEPNPHIVRNDDGEIFMRHVCERFHLKDNVTVCVDCGMEGWDGVLFQGHWYLNEPQRDNS